MDYTRVDESVRQGLIQDECELSQFITCSQLGSLSLYLQALEQLIEGGKKEHIDELRLSAERLPENRRGEFWAMNYPGEWDGFATQFRESFVILAFSVLERNINLFCRDTGIVAQTKIGLNEIKGPFLEKTNLFLYRLVGFQRPTADTWKKLKNMYEIRNALVHHYGDYVEDLHLENKLSEFLKHAKGIKVNQGFIEITSEFCKEVFETIEGCFTELHLEQSALCQRVDRRVSRVTK